MGFDWGKLVNGNAIGLARGKHQNNKTTKSIYKTKPIDMLSNKSTQFAKLAVNRLLKQNQSVRFFGAAKSFVSYVEWIIESCNIYLMYASFHYSNNKKKPVENRNGIFS